MAKRKPIEPKKFDDSGEIKLGEAWYPSSDFIKSEGIFGFKDKKFSRDLLKEPGTEPWFVFAIKKPKLSCYYIATDGQVYYDLNGDEWVHYGKPSSYVLRKTSRKARNPDKSDKAIIDKFMEKEATIAS